MTIANSKISRGLAALALTWLFLFWWLSFFIQLILAPWDAAIDLPAIGTWQRTLNDFFQGEGKFMLAGLLLLVSVGLTLVILRRDSKLAWQMAGINVLFGVGLYVCFLIAALINNAVYPYPPVSYDPNYRGYYRAVIPGAALLLVYGGWLLWQIRINKSSYRALSQIHI